MEIEPGMPDKYVFTFPGEGEPHAEGDSGDLTVLLRLQRWHKLLNLFILHIFVAQVLFAIQVISDIL